MSDEDRGDDHSCESECVYPDRRRSNGSVRGSATTDESRRNFDTNEDVGRDDISRSDTSDKTGREKGDVDSLSRRRMSSQGNVAAATTPGGENSAERRGTSERAKENVFNGNERRSDDRTDGKMEDTQRSDVSPTKNAESSAGNSQETNGSASRVGAVASDGTRSVEGIIKSDDTIGRVAVGGEAGDCGKSGGGDGKEIATAVKDGTSGDEQQQQVPSSAGTTASSVVELKEKAEDQ